MSTQHSAIRIVAAAAVALAGCSSSPPEQSQAPTGLQSSAQLRQDTTIRGAYIYRAPDVDAGKYRSLMIEPVVVYNGPEAHFGSFSGTDQKRFAQIIEEEFRNALAQKYRISQAPGPDVLRAKVTLLGVERTVGGLATATRVLPIGIALNAVRGISGGGGSMTGGIELALEFFDAETGRLLLSAVRQQAPGVFDVEATLSTEDTVRSAARSVAADVSDGMAKRAPHMAIR